MWLVRHGESTWNVQGLVQGQADDAHLTARGRGQAQRAAETLRHKSIAAIYTSDLRRAEQTARTIGCALELPVHSDPALRERSFGSREGLTLSLLDSSETGIRGDRIIDADARPDGGESLEDVYRRIAAFVRHLAEQQHSGDVVIVAHGGSIRALRAYCTGRSFQDAPWDVVSNGSVHGVQLPVHTSLRHP